MFKAKSIEDESYYRFRRRMMILSIFSVIPMAIAVALSDRYYWWILLGLGVIAIVLQYSQYKAQKGLESTLGKRKIEINHAEIKIKAKNDQLIQNFPVDEVTKIILQENYGLAPENSDEIVKELRGNQKKSYLTVHANGGSHRLNFEIESHYMLVQLNKVIDHWKSRNIALDFV